MAITARGAWESVKQHFAQLDIDIQNNLFSVLGIGDMSGDVFGNGMLLSKNILLKAAFNHIYIFLDPNPDSIKSFKERYRLYNLLHSRWSDYDKSSLSCGGIIISRQTKSIKLTPEIKEMLNTDLNYINPNNLIKLILKMKVDLIWNGGIGTYVKSAIESHEAVGDKANDLVRINADQLQCKVIVEGGNLGLTQLGRIDFSKNGGLINTDAIDNSAGVNCSDYEVNIKILLNQLIEKGLLAPLKRNELLESMQEEVASLVLANNKIQNSILKNFAKRRNLSYTIEACLRLMKSLEQTVQLDTQVEFLPSIEEMQERKNISEGLTNPETSVLLSYTKIMLKDKILKSSLPDDEYCQAFLKDYFPSRLYYKYYHQMKNHKLAREIVSTQITNLFLMKMGITFVQRMRDETGASDDCIVKAFLLACHIFNLHDIWDDLDNIDILSSININETIQRQLFKYVRRAVRWIIMHEDLSKPISQSSSKYSNLDQILIVSFEVKVEQYSQQIEDMKKIGIKKNTREKILILKYNRAMLSMASTMIDAKDFSSYIHMNEYVNKNLYINKFKDILYQMSSHSYWSELAITSARDELDELEFRLTLSIIKACSNTNNNVEEKFKIWFQNNSRKANNWINFFKEILALEPKFELMNMAMKTLKNMIEDNDK